MAKGMDFSTSRRALRREFLREGKSPEEIAFILDGDDPPVRSLVDVQVGGFDDVVDGPDPDGSEFVHVCEKCGVQLNPFTDGFGRESYRHSREYMVHDHEPVPVEIPRSAPRNQDCDFCGSTTKIYWVFEGERARVSTPSGGVHDYGTKWSACKDCAPFVLVRHTEGLFDHIMRVSRSMANFSSDMRPQVRKALDDLTGKFVRSIKVENYVGPKIEPLILHPRMLPKIQQGLGKMWRHPHLHDIYEFSDSRSFSMPGAHYGDESMFSVRKTNQPRAPKEAFEKHVNHIASGIDVSKLYWISEDFTSLATIAGQDLTELTLTSEDLPSRFGLLVWARPIGEIKRPAGMAGLRAVSWTPVPGGLWLNVYFQADDADPLYNVEYRQEFGYFQSPSLGTGIPWDETGEVTDSMRTDNQFILTLFSTFFLMRQPGVVVESEAPVDKKLIRSLKRSGYKIPDVRVVDLRRHVRGKPESVEEAAERRKISVRFMVRGHWKNQAYGPARSLRRPIYISPFIKGPDDAPLKHEIPTVRVLR